MDVKRLAAGGVAVLCMVLGGFVLNWFVGDAMGLEIAVDLGRIKVCFGGTGCESMPLGLAARQEGPASTGTLLVVVFQTTRALAAVGILCLAYVFFLDLNGTSTSMRNVAAGAPAVVFLFTLIATFLGLNQLNEVGPAAGPFVLGLGAMAGIVATIRTTGGGPRFDADDQKRLLSSVEAATGGRRLVTADDEDRGSALKAAVAGTGPSGAYAAAGAIAGGALPAVNADPMADAPRPDAVKINVVKRQHEQFVAGGSRRDKVLKTLRWTAAEAQVGPRGIAARDAFGNTARVPWTTLTRIVVRRLPPEAPYEGTLFVDLISDTSPPLRIVSDTKLNYDGLPEGAARTYRENLRRLASTVTAQSSSIQLDDATRAFVDAGRRPPRFAAFRNFAVYDARLG